MIGRLKSIRAHGMGSDRYENIRLGINGRLETIQAAILLQKLTIFDEEIALRQTIASTYDQLLSDAGVVGHDRVVLPKIAAGNLSAWAQYTLLLPSGTDRLRLINDLKTAEIPTMVYYPIPLHRQAAYRDYPVAATGVPASETLAARVLSLPMHPYLKPETQARIVTELTQALRA